ncbi:hypothetical protein O0I10_006408 [Lichtheimia ornata]|uniref:C2H2-type domain-containing protein n=1 Tax=Lichtheimia ornata TaxID=688661 RepID=A0AAD7V2Z5_9FUNG|nr:uncharacterized protein O0I10_006408 [Lichtheimia ornata]KAJ8657880.1 hypothetical protein O0I10_006408 [Lichtheimia ornata]
MYSPTYVAPQQPTTFDNPAAPVGDCGFPLGNMYTEPQDYMRRFSYAELLSNHSEASFSDTEQQTPSPSNDYEDYVYNMQHCTSFDDKRFVPSYLDMYASGTPQHPAATTTTTTPAQWLFTTTQQQQQQQQYIPPTMFDYTGASLVDAAALTAAPTAVMPSAVAGSPPLLSLPSSDNASTHSNINNNNPNDNNNNMVAQKQSSPTTKKQGAKKPAARSRGRRVSSNPGAAGQKMFTCQHDDCGKVFKRSEHLKRHIRSIHTLEKPFECPYHSCSKRFSRSDNLNQHIRIHRHTTKDKLSPSTGANSNSRTVNTYMQNFL